MKLIKGCILSDTSTELEHETNSEQYNEEHNTDQLLTKKLPSEMFPLANTTINYIRINNNNTNIIICHYKY